MNRRILWVFLVVWGCAAVVPTGAEEAAQFGDEIPVADGIAVRTYGDLTELQIEGNQLFTDEELREELGRHLRLLAACRPTAELIPLIDLLEEVLQEAYRQSGCPDARITVSPAVDRPYLQAVVEEGHRYEAGDVQLRGVEPALVDYLKKHLTRSKQDDTSRKGIYLARGLELLKQEKSGGELWIMGEPVRGSKTQLAKLRQVIAKELAKAGYPLAKFELEIAPNSKESAHLVIDITELGARANLDVIELQGLDRHSREEFLALMGIAEGDPLDMEVFAAAYDRVQDSCRFWRHDFVVQFPVLEDPKWRYDTADPRTKLVVKILEYDIVPKLSEPLDEQDEVLRRAGKWTREFFEQDEWVLKVHYWSGKTYHKVSDLEVDGLYSPLEGVLLDVGFLFTHAGSAKTHEVAAVSRPNYFAISNIAGDGRHTLATDTMAQITFNFTGAEKVEGLFQASFYFAMAASTDQAAPSQVPVTIDPVVLVHEAHRPASHVERKGEVLVIERPGANWRIDIPTGRVIEVELNDGQHQQVRISTVKRDEVQLDLQFETFEALPDQHDREDKHASLVRWIDELCVELAPEAPLVPPVVRKMVLDYLANEAGTGLEAADERGDSKVPKSWKFQLAEGGADTGFSWDGLVASLATNSDCLFERETWPWTFVRELGLNRGELLAKERSLWKQELVRALCRDDTGPIAYDALLQLEVVDRDGAEAGLEKFDDGSFEREVEMLTTPDTGMMKLLAKVVPVVQGLPEEDTNWLCRLAGDDVAPKLEEVTRLLRKLDASSDEALQQSLRGLLEGEIRERVEADLRAAAGAPDAAE
jgi:hypothetical protein